MGTGQWAIVVGLLVTCAAGMISVGWQRRHQRALAQLARRLNLNYIPDDRLGLPWRYRRLTLFGRGHSRRASRVISGPAPFGAVSCFRYAYEVGSGGHREVRCWCVAVIESDRDLPSASVGPATGEGSVDDVWLDAVPDAAKPMSLQGHAGIRASSTDAVGARGVAWADRLADWVSALDRPCGVETGGRLAAVFVPAPDSPERIGWLLHVATDMAEKIHRVADA
ncbi:MAG: hypothetical protein JSV19_07355 [Phycisphaerales bacterium]|nr:MAG: hypothetical protein JSV19_07355 [Phycisphaerales bacterium]